MSGDVQPRKRKDKKRKKDDLGVDEPRGTSAALGEGDVFIHSHHDHGTGGHWCAKIIFFSLLFVLVGLIGLIILENRGLSELEANSVQSQYSGVLEGWLEDAPDDDHHDEHTLDLKHHDDHDEEAEHSEEAENDDDEHDEDEEHDDDDEHDEEAENSEEADDDDEDDEDHADDDEEEENDDEPREDDDDDERTQENLEEQDENDSEENDLGDNYEEEDIPYRKYYQDTAAEPDDDDDDENNQDDDDDDDDVDDDLKYADNDEQDTQLSNEIEQNDDEDEDNNQSIEQEDDDQNNQDDEGDSNEQNDEDDEEHEEEEEDTSLEVEKIEKEAPEDEEPIDVELPALPEQDDDDDDDDKSQGSVEDAAGDDDADDGDDDNDGDDDDTNEPDDDFLEADDDEPPVERITAPSGKPFDEVEDEPSSEKPTDTLEDEEEYERRQEQLRKEEAEASHMWLKLSIGGALLVATHAIVRRATASSDVPQSEDSREVTPAIDRRMTLIPEEPSEPVPIIKGSQQSSRPVIQELSKQIPSITRKSPTFEESEEDEEAEPVQAKDLYSARAIKEQEKKELYSDEEEADEEDVEEEVEEPIVHKKAAPAAAKPPPKEPSPEPEEDVPDDVEIIDDEQIEEEVDEEVEDEEEISDVDDEELLTRLEAKYGRLPEPERPARRKDGGNSIEGGWPGEPADAYWRQQLDDAEREFNQGALMAAADRAGAVQLKNSARARWIVAKSLDAAAERKRDNALLGRAIAAYLELLKMNERLSDKKLIEIAERAINRIQFRGTYLNAEPIYRLLIRRFPDEPSHRTNLTVTFLMADRGDLAEETLKETLKRWPNDRLALAQYGFILKTQHNRLEEALDLLQRALEGDTGPATEPRYYYHLGDTLLLLGRFDEAHEVHKRGAALGHFLSAAQRSLYNIPRLEGRPWWNAEETPYIKLARDLEKHWKEILKEGEAAKALYDQEKEGLKERGEWTQLDLFVRGREIDGRCARAPVTCAVVRREVAAVGCRRGQIKFSSMLAGTHVRPHVGPTNCRLRMHLGLSNTKDTFIRVHQETRQWETGKVLVFDDSFEHEVWHNGTGARLVLIVDVWHPGLSAAERRQLPPI